MLIGWIGANEDQREELEAMGIELGEYNVDQFENCKVTDEAFEKLDPKWGRFIWGLIRA